jgi:hypothetical protein
MTAIRSEVRRWLADHLPPLVIVTLALWAPPVVFTVLVDLRMVDGVGSGYPSLRDPALLLSGLQVALMGAALPCLRYSQARGWQLLAGACGVWMAHAAWVLQARLRLLGLRDLVSKETLITMAAMTIAIVILHETRQRFSRARTMHRLGSELTEPDRT